MAKIFVVLVGSLWLVLAGIFAVRGAILRLFRGDRRQQEPD